MERFWNKVNFNGTHSKKLGHCWEWTAGLSPDGYGKFKTGGKTYRAHRFSVYLRDGEIDDNLQALHKCDNPLCVRPDHLFMGTPQDNMSDKVNKGRHRCPKGSQCTQAKLTEEQVVEMRKLRKLPGYTLSVLGRQFGVSISAVSAICLGRRWA